MSKFLIDCGHCLNGADTGAEGNGYLEQNCTREIGYKVKAKLESLGHEVVVVNPDYATSVGQSLAYRTRKANDLGGDFYISIHINAGGGRGVQVHTCNCREYKEAVGVLNAISSVGFVNRGIQEGKGLYVINHTDMTAMLIECCFIDTDDMQKYNAEMFANAIVKGLTGQSVDEQPKDTNRYHIESGVFDNKEICQNAIDRYFTSQGMYAECVDVESNEYQFKIQANNQDEANPYLWRMWSEGLAAEYKNGYVTSGIFSNKENCFRLCSKYFQNTEATIESIETKKYKFISGWFVGKDSVMTMVYRLWADGLAGDIVKE